MIRSNNFRNDVSRSVNYDKYITAFQTHPHILLTIKTHTFISNIPIAYQYCLQLKILQNIIDYIKQELNAKISFTIK